MFSGISSCGTLRSAPCRVTLHGRGPCLIAFLLVAAFPVGPPHVAENGPFSQGPIQRIYQRRGRVNFPIFGPVGLHFLSFWPCGLSFPCIFAFWAFISLHFGLAGLHFLAPWFLAFWPCVSFHFGLVGLHFLSFWLFRGQLLGPPLTSCQKWPVCPTSLQWIYQRRDRLHFAVFSLVGLHFLAFGFVGLHFLAFWPCGHSFPCILALWAYFLAF